MTDEPIDPGDTIPPPAANDTELPPLCIPAGRAQITLSAALDDLARVFVLVEGVAMALARQLDAQAKQEAP